MADYNSIDVELDEDIAVIRLNRPEVMNALSSDMRGELTLAVDQASSRARVVVLTGNGPAFCSGQDLGDSKTVLDANLERTLRDEYFPMLHAIRDCSVPTIAAVNGPAAGAGANLALAADIVIASESAYFLQAFARIGLVPDAGGTWIMPRSIGLPRAMGAALFAEPISARQACDWGLIWEWASDEDFVDHWRARARQLAKGPSEAYRRMKAALRVSFEQEFQSQLDLEARLQGEAGKTRDFREGVLAFVEKRTPDFEGR